VGRKGKQEDLNEPTIEVKVEFKGAMAKRFQALKDKLGFTNNTDLLRMIVARTYEEELGKS